MSDGGRERASLVIKVSKSSQKWSVRRSAVRSIAWLGLLAWLRRGVSEQLIRDESLSRIKTGEHPNIIDEPNRPLHQRSRSVMYIPGSNCRISTLVATSAPPSVASLIMMSSRRRPTWRLRASGRPGEKRTVACTKPRRSAPT